MIALRERIMWFRNATPFVTALIDSTPRSQQRIRPRRHALARLRLSNRDEDEVLLSPVMWTLFDL